MRSKFALLALLAAFPLTAPAEPGYDPQDEKALKDVEVKVTEAKEDVYRTKARLHELEEAVLRGKMVGSKALVTFDNRAEGFFALSSAEFFLDGKLVWKVNAEEKKQPVETVKVFDGDVPAGEHTLEARILYRGSDKSVYTMFSYFKDHKFEVKAKETFSVDYGKTSQVKLVALDRGYFKTDLNERLLVEIRTQKDWSSGSPE